MKQTPEEKANRELMMQLTGWAGIHYPMSPLYDSLVFDHFLDVFLQQLTKRRWRNLECVLKIPSYFPKILYFPELYKVKEVQSFNELTLN